MLSKISAATFLAFAFLGLLKIAQTKDLPEYTALESAKHIGETALVTDKVEDVYQAKSGHIFLNMGGRHPNETFTVFIPAPAASAFKDFKVYQGKTITVSGKIQDHQGKPEIVVKSPGQITSEIDDISGAAASPSPAPSGK